MTTHTPRIFYAALLPPRGASRKNFSLLDLRTGAQRILTELPVDFVIRDFDISAAGSEIVFDRVQANSDLALIERTG